MSLVSRLCLRVGHLLTRQTATEAGLRSSLHTTARPCGIFEPDDVGLGPEVPEYEELNIQMRGYDYPTLESYAKFVHGLAERLGLEADAWAVPPRTALVQTYKPNSTHVEKEYNLSLCERCVQLQDVPSTTLPLFIEIARTNLPEGIKLTVKQPSEEENEFRFIPDKDLIELHDQLDAIAQAREDRRKK